MPVSYQRSSPKYERDFLDSFFRIVFAGIFAIIVTVGKLLIGLLLLPFYLALASARASMKAGASTLSLEDEEEG